MGHEKYLMAFQHYGASNTVLPIAKKMLGKEVLIIPHDQAENKIKEPRWQGLFNCKTTDYWGIENNLHWVLDTAFKEDDQRTRLGNSAANMAILRHIALNLIKSDKTAKIGIKNRRLKAGWDDEYLLQLVLSGQSLTDTKT